jgi:hypothetical protein
MLDFDMEFFKALSSKTPSRYRSNLNSSDGIDIPGPGIEPEGSSSAPPRSARFDDGKSPTSELSRSSQQDPSSNHGMGPSRAFVPVDELPLRFRDFDAVPFLSTSGDPGRTNPMEMPFSSIPSHHFQSGHVHGSLVGEFPVHLDTFTEGGDRSVRRMSGVENITTRENKRPKERNKDKEYRRLTLPSSNVPSSVPFSSDIVGAQRLSVAKAVPSNGQGGLSSSFVSTPSPSGERGGGHSAFRSRTPVSPTFPFEIKLVYEGRTVVCSVSERMSVFSLIQEASNAFHLDPTTVILMLFSMTPTTLDRNPTLFGPPRVAPNSTVLVFVVHSQPAVQDTHLIPPSAFFNCAWSSTNSFQASGYF